jgi:hypothetical protein
LNKAKAAEQNSEKPSKSETALSLPGPAVPVPLANSNEEEEPAKVAPKEEKPDANAAQAEVTPATTSPKVNKKSLSELQSSFRIRNEFASTM